MALSAMAFATLLLPAAAAAPRAAPAPLCSADGRERLSSQRNKSCWKALPNAACAVHTSCAACASVCGCDWCNTSGAAPSAQGFCWPSTGGACAAPALAPRAANVLTIGDSISAGFTGYHLNVEAMLSANESASERPLVGFYEGAALPLLSSKNAAASLVGLIGNTSGQLPPRAWSVITYNAGLHDCDTQEWVSAADYAANLRAALRILKPAASAVYFVTSTPFDMPHTNAGITMACVLERNAIARRVATEVGGILLNDLYQYVEDFCDKGKLTSLGNYSKCAIQTTGLHFFNTAPLPSGQQYTGLSIANAVVRGLPASALGNSRRGGGGSESLAARALPRTRGAPVCGAAPTPLNTHLPNVLLIGDSISDTGSGYGPAVREMLQNPRPRVANPPQPQTPTGPLAAVQHSGGWAGQPGANEQAGSSAKGARCIESWLGPGGWDVIALNFGLHDCCDAGHTKPIPAANYSANLAEVYSKARNALAPGGKLLWVETTPVSSTNRFNIKNSCVKEYNGLAAKLFANTTDVVTCDLNQAVTGVCGDDFDHCPLQKQQGDVHFTPAGRQVTAVVVAHAIAPLLGPKWSTLAGSSLKTTDGEARPTSGRPKPHVLMVLADDLGWANVGWNRAVPSKEVVTPTLDGLVRQGIELQQYYAFKYCSPTRSALQSGRNPIHVNVVNGPTTCHNPDDPVSGYSGIPMNMTTLAEKMRKAGYIPHAIGKWHAGMAKLRQTPAGRGYESWIGCKIVMLSRFVALSVSLIQIVSLFLTTEPATITGATSTCAEPGCAAAPRWWICGSRTRANRPTGRARRTSRGQR